MDSFLVFLLRFSAQKDRIKEWEQLWKPHCTRLIRPNHINSFKMKNNKTYNRLLERL